MKEILITFFYFAGPWAVTPQTLPPAKIIAIAQQCSPAPIRLAGVVRRNTFAKEIYNLGDWRKLGYRAFAYLRRQKRVRGIRMGLLHPIVDGASRYIAGKTEGHCHPSNGVTVAFVQAVRDNGESHVDKSAAISAHEVCHVLGAEHDDTIYPWGASLMHSDAGRLMIGPPTASERSKVEVRGCLQRRGFRKSR